MKCSHISSILCIMEFNQMLNSSLLFSICSQLLSCSSNFARFSANFYYKINCKTIICTQECNNLNWFLFSHGNVKHTYHIWKFTFAAFFHVLVTLSTSSVITLVSNWGNVRVSWVNCLPLVLWCSICLVWLSRSVSALCKCTVKCSFMWYIFNQILFIPYF